MFPKVELTANVLPITRSLLRVDLVITPDFSFDSTVHDYSQLFWVMVEDTNGEKLLHCETLMIKQEYASQEHSLQFTVPLTDPSPPQYFVRVVSDRWLHASYTLPISFRHLQLPSKFAPPTELLDLAPLLVSALHNTTYETIYTKSFEHFNAIQTQTFSTLYKSGDNVLLCAPTGSGKTVCAELTILAMINKYKSSQGSSNSKCVYIAAKQVIIHILLLYYMYC